MPMARALFSQPGPERGHDGQGEEDGRDGEEHVGDPHDDARRPAPEVTGHDPGHGPDDPGDGHGHAGDLERYVQALQDQREKVAPELVRPQRVAEATGDLSTAEGSWAWAG